MQATSWAALGTGAGGLLSGATMAWRARSQNRLDRTQARIDHKDLESADRRALAKAVETVQAVYEKLTGDLREQVDDLIQRDKECRAELNTLRLTVRAHGQELGALREQVEEGS